MATDNYIHHINHIKAIPYQQEINFKNELFIFIYLFFQMEKDRWTCI